MKLPEPIAAYYAAQNRHDIDGMAASFTENAVVRDEGATHRGRPAIKEWMEETERRYSATAAPTHAKHSGATTAVDAVVSGNFPGSPIKLTYRFELSGDGISALEIG